MAEKEIEAEKMRLNTANRPHVLFNRVSYDGTLAVRKSHQVNNAAARKSGGCNYEFGSPATT